MEQLQSWRGTPRLLGNTVAFADDSKRMHHGSTAKPLHGRVGMSLVLDQNEDDMNRLDEAIEQRVAGKYLHLSPLASGSATSFGDFPPSNKGCNAPSGPRTDENGDPKKNLPRTAPNKPRTAPNKPRTTPRKKRVETRKPRAKKTQGEKDAEIANIMEALRTR
jgi:hypothetical protein